MIGSGNNYPLISDIESSVELEGEDSFGKVTGGYLTAPAQIIEVKLTEDQTTTKVGLYSHPPSFRFSLWTWAVTALTWAEGERTWLEPEQSPSILSIP
jgi:hypothetical protein